jgi:hypothetical protein
MERRDQYNNKSSPITNLKKSQKEITNKESKEKQKYKTNEIPTAQSKGKETDNIQHNDTEDDSNEDVQRNETEIEIPELVSRWNGQDDDDSDDDDNEDITNIPKLQDRDRCDSDSEDEEEDDDEVSLTQHPLRDNPIGNEVENGTTENPKSLEKGNTLNRTEATPMASKGPTITSTEGNIDEDLYYMSSDEEYEEEETKQPTNNYKNICTTETEVINNTNNNNNRERTKPTEQRRQTTTDRMKVTIDNTPFGHICDNVAIDNDTPYVRVYCQNVCGIFDRDGIGLDTAFQKMKQAGADIFTFNETHGDDSKATARRVLRLSKRRMWQNNNEDCKIVHSSSTAPVLSFTKPGGNLVGVTGALVGRVRETIKDPYGRWCGFTMIGKDMKEILVLTAYNVSQYKNAKVGDDTLFNQQVALYKLKNIREPDPKKIFIEDLTELIRKARSEDKDIILTGDFNELVGDDPRGMTKVLEAGNLTDAHGHQHGNVDITTYTRGTKRLDYVFVTPRLVDHILRSGYESFHARIASDHRGYYVDFALAGFLDRQLPSIFSASSRAIRGTHPKNITKYVKHLHSVFEERDIYRRVKQQKHWYEKKKLEALDREITAVMLEAEEQCRIHHREPWNEEVNEVMTTANILRIQLSSLRNNLDCTKQIKQKQRLLKNVFELPTTIKEATIALRTAQKNCRTLINEGRTKQTAMEKEQETAYVAMNPEMGAKRAAQIFQRAKDTKQMMSELPSKQNCPGAISAILVPMPKEGIELEYCAITDGSTIESVILNRNIRHFRQAESTPLATPEVIKIIGFGADTERSEQLLEGTTDPTDITDDEWSRFLLTSMKRHSKELKITITAEKMMGKYKRWKERTSTSPSGRHLGHYHALFRPLKAKNDKEREKLDDLRQEIIEMHAMMLQTAYDNEHVYKRWEYILTCMLGKDEGVPRIHRLRIIHLYECDLNLLFSLCFREMDQHCEDNYLINKGVCWELN